jgi:hypothetical protein
MAGRNQTQEQLLHHLLELLPALGITVREEEVEGSSGGLYLFKGKRFLLVNKNRPVDEKIDLLAEALRKEDLSGVYVLPAIRELLGQGA